MRKKKEPSKPISILRMIEKTMSTGSSRYPETPIVRPEKNKLNGSIKSKSSTSTSISEKPESINEYKEFIDFYLDENNKNESFENVSFDSSFDGVETVSFDENNLV